MKADEIIKKKKSRKALGQSLVEFVVLLPILIMMLSGLIEFGFMLNYYLDLIDAAREAARFAADDDPLIREGALEGQTDTSFYILAQQMVIDSLGVGSGGQLVLNTNPADPEAHDDIVISVFSVKGGPTVTRYPAGSPLGLSYASNRTSKYTSAEIAGMLSSDALAPETGLVMIEIYFDYHMILGLPWITPFVPDPITLHAYSIMPNSSIEPTPTP